MKRRWIREAIELPLLAKELKELAARRRTYLVRVIYAALLFIGSCVLLYGGFGSQGAATMGQGGQIFRQLVLCQFAGIVFFLPAMAAGCLTAEKERDALALLLLTTLRPGQIMMQKFLSRQVPMLSFLLLSFPLQAVAYSYGGVNEGELAWGIVLLVLTCLQVGAVSTMCSAYFRTTGEAFVGTYVILALIYVTAIFSGLAAFQRMHRNDDVEVGGAAMLIVLSIVICLVVARAFIVTRAFVPPRNFLLQLFRALDGFFNSANSVTGGIILVKDRDVSPRSDPIAWRETRKKSLGTFRYQFRILVLLELPIFFACQLIRTGNRSPTTTAVTILAYLLWCIAPAMIAVHAAGVISSERSRQTLDVLLTLPIEGRDILRQKFAGVKRLICTLCIPFLTIYLFETWWYTDPRLPYLLVSVMQMIIYLTLAAWLSMWIGLKIKSHLRAIIVSLLSLAGAAALPIAIRSLFPWTSSGLSSVLSVISPVDAIVRTETWGLGLRGVSMVDLPTSTLFRELCGNLAFYAFLLCLCRYLCYRKVDARLGRVGIASPPLLEKEPVVRESPGVATQGA